PSSSNGRREPRADTYQNQRQHLPDNHPDEAASVGSESHPHSNLLSPVNDSVGHESIKTDRCEQEAQRTEEAGECGDHSLLGQRFINQGRKSLDAGDRNIFTNLRNLSSDRRNEADRIPWGPYGAGY